MRARGPTGDFGSSSTQGVHGGPPLALSIQSLARHTQPTPRVCQEKSLLVGEEFDKEQETVDM